MSAHMIYYSVVLNAFTLRRVSIQFISPCTCMFVPQAMPSTGTPGRSRVAVPSPVSISKGLCVLFVMFFLGNWLIFEENQPSQMFLPMSRQCLDLLNVFSAFFVKLQWLLVNFQYTK